MHWYDVINWLILIYFLLLNGSYIFMTLLAFFSIRQYHRASQLSELHHVYTTRFCKPISLLVPAHNEAKTIVGNLHSLLNLDYPQYEIVVVNDGSEDETLAVLKENFKLTPVPQAIAIQLPCQPIKQTYISSLDARLVVVDKVNGGKADALNAAINVSSFPLICSIDSDSILERDGLLKVVRPFIDSADTVAVGGIIRIANGCKMVDYQVVDAGIPNNLWARFQVVEYLRAFLFGRMGWSSLNALLIISGAFGMFRKKVVIAVGGYNKDSVGEDMELIVRLHRMLRERKQPYRITFVPDPVCWTEVPETYKTLAAQRARWQKGLADALWRNGKLCFNPRYGWIGLFAYPFFLCFELFGSIVETFGFFFFLWSLLTGLIDWPFALLFFSVAVFLGILLSTSSVVLEELFFHRYIGWQQLFTLWWYGVMENFFYRQIHTLWRLKGFIQFLTGNRSWGKMTRKGFTNMTG